MNVHLRAHRQGQGLQVDDVARALGVHRTSVLRWERRERLPAPAQIRGLATVLRIDAAAVSSFFDQARPAAPAVTSLRGHGLREVRRRHGRGVRELAEAAGVPVSTVYNWEAGRVRVPHGAAARLAPLFELDTAGLAGLLRAAPAAAPARPATSPLRRLRRRTGLSQQVLADRIGVSRYSVGCWERGATPPLSAVRRLARVLGVPTGELARAVGLTAPAMLDRRQWTPGSLAGVLRVLRAWAGHTQREVGALTGRSTDAVRSWEAGRAVPPAAVLARLERVYGLEADSLLRTAPPCPAATP